jgi:hypothetical protein
LPWFLPDLLLTWLTPTRCIRGLPSGTRAEIQQARDIPSFGPTLIVVIVAPRFSPFSLFDIDFCAGVGII